MHAAEDDVAAVGFGSLVGKLEGVAAKIGKFDDFVALIVMAKNDGVFSELGFGGSDAVVEGVVGNQKIGVKIAAHARFDFGRVYGIRRLGADKGRRARDGDKGTHRLCVTGWVS